LLFFLTLVFNKVALRRVLVVAEYFAIPC